MAGLEPATEGSLQISGRVFYPLCHRRPIMYIGPAVSWATVSDGRGSQWRSGKRVRTGICRDPSVAVHTFKDINGGGQGTLPEEKTIDGLKDAQSGNQGQEEETGADQKQDGWMTSGEQQSTMTEEGTRSEEMDDICRELHPAVDGQSLHVTK
ncbi:hypothetical protein PoB_002486800 [Plakobranchus ocellatus]|uniref:Uncharacterized protein n=1 Tax=Plakobranchus ocellatus TaxID=259542 RepID=A0AAV3ZVA3_9GAST|nr:hypothetical protein PoB_002486800 [Plakobranchus ocellatus]